MMIENRKDGLMIAVPILPEGLSADAIVKNQRVLIDELILDHQVSNYTLWYYTPMALEFSRHLKPDRVIFDAMDELSAFKNAPQQMLDLEKELMRLADHVFTGGHSLYEAKKDRHPSVHAFPSSIDHEHFEKARSPLLEPLDQRRIAHPKVGFFGVVDERFDVDLLAACAVLRPDWQFVIIGPVVKISEIDLPRAKNIHYLGLKKYIELPSYLSHWDLAMLPFALNESTKFISPTKTPEYLAAGKPVVSTAIRDVVRPYGEKGFVHIIEGAEQFCAKGAIAMHERADDPHWFSRVDQLLAGSSWDQTWSQMAALESEVDCYSVASVRDVPTSSLH